MECQHKCWVAIGHSSFTRFLLVRMCGTLPFTPPRQKMSSWAFGFEDVVWREPQGQLMCPTLTRKGSSLEWHCLSQHATHLWARWQSGWSWTCWKIRKVRLPLKGPLSHCWEICFRKNRHLRWYPPRSGSHTTWTRATPGLTWAWAYSPTPPAVCLPDWVGMFLPCPVGSDSGKHRWPLTPGPLLKSLCLSLWHSECGSRGQSEPPSAWCT